MRNNLKIYSVSNRKKYNSMSKFQTIRRKSFNWNSVLLNILPISAIKTYKLQNLWKKYRSKSRIART